MKKEKQKKTSFREHFINIRNVIRTIRELDKHYFGLCGMVHLINVLNPFLLLYLSSYTMDGIVSGRVLKELFPVILAILGTNLILSYIASSVWHRMEARRERIYYLYSCNVQMKLMEMDYSKIDSPIVKTLREKIQNNDRWGWGINTFIFAINSMVYYLINVIVALVVGYPAFLMLLRVDSFATVVALCIIFFLAVVLFQCQEYLRKKDYGNRYYIFPEEDREEVYDGSWSLANQQDFSYQNIKDIKIYQGEGLLRRWTVEQQNTPKNKKYYHALSMTMALRTGLSVGSNTMLESAAYIMVAVIALAGKIAVGNVILFSGSLQKLFCNFFLLLDEVKEIMHEAEKQSDIIEMIALKDDMYKGKIPMEKRSDNQYQIEFVHVYFKYPGSETYALKDVSLKLTIGEKLAIVGMNGSGKTTLIKLLCRLYDVDKGEILLNGVNIQKYDLKEYRRLFSVVFQDYKIMPYTIRENVTAVAEARDGVTESLEKAGFSRRLSALEKGTDTYVGKSFEEEGVEFSGGERQKMALARAIYKKAPFVLLDEPTASLDPMAEYEIYKNFDEMVKDKTAIYISHRLSSCQFCQKIAVFHKGSIVQLGSHEKLVKDKNGKYYELWNAQAKYYDGGDKKR